MPLPPISLTSSRPHCIILGHHRKGLVQCNKILWEREREKDRIQISYIVTIVLFYHRLLLLIFYCAYRYVWIEKHVHIGFGIFCVSGISQHIPHRKGGGRGYYCNHFLFQLMGSEYSFHFAPEIASCDHFHWYSFIIEVHNVFILSTWTSYLYILCMCLSRSLMLSLLFFWSFYLI